MPARRQLAAARLEPAVLPLNCSHAAFAAAWRTHRCVVLRRNRSVRSTRSASAVPSISQALLSTLSENSNILERTFAAESEDAAARGSKRTKRGPPGLLPKPPATAAALLGGGGTIMLPAGRYYASFVISQQQSLIRSLLDHLRGLAPPCLSGSSIRQEEALWFFVGCNASAGEYLHGRPSHTDAVKHDGTFHRQLAGRKEWELRPTEELLSSLGLAPEAAAATSRIVCEEGDVLVISTREWWHCTRLPPGSEEGHGQQESSANGRGLSMSIAREFNLSEPGRDAGGPVASEGTTASFINVDGLFATARIVKGTVVLTEEEAEGLELPLDADPNCEVCEDEETGQQVLVARRDICSGEFFSIGADEDDED
jgi:hypothetical protein